MKIQKKFLGFVLALFLCIGITVPVLAAPVSQDGLEITLTTDKDAYRRTERIIATLAVKNTNDFSVTDVNLECLIPEGYKLIKDASPMKQIESLGAGETITLSITYLPDSTSGENGKPGDGNSGSGNSSNGGNEGSGNIAASSQRPSGGSVNLENTSNGSSAQTSTSPKTGDSMSSILGMVFLTLCCCLIIIALKKKKGKKLLSLFLTLSMLGTILFPSTAQAAPVKQRMGNIEKIVKVDGTDLKIEGKVTYSLNDDGGGGDSEIYTRGQWIYELAKKVGMNLDTDPASIDYYYIDARNSEYGVAIETAEIYGILPAPNVDDLEQDVPFFYPDQEATREFAAYTAVRAMGFDGTHSYDTSNWADWDSIAYQGEAAIAVAYQMFSLDDSNKFNPAAAITSVDVDTIFKAIDEIRNSSTVSGESSYDNTEYAENVIRDELKDITGYSVVNSGGFYTVTIPKSDKTKGIADGKVIILPANDEYITGLALKVTAATDNGSQLVLTCVEPQLEDVFTHIDFAGDGTAIVNAFVPADGVTWEYDSNGSVNNDDSGNLYPRTYGGSTKIPGTLKFSTPSKKIAEYLKASASVEIEIPDVTCALDADIGLLSGIKVNEFTMSVQEKIKFNAKMEYTLAESGYELTNSSGNTRFEAGRIELGRLPIALGTTGLSFDIVFFFNLSAKGTASITYTLVSTQGYQYKNGTSRAIFDYDDSLDLLELKGSVKAGVGIAGDICAFNMMDLVGYSAEAGPAFDASFKPHVLGTDTLYCGDVTFYAYAKSGLDKETAVGKFLDKVCHYTLEFEHLKNNADNPYKLKYHVENGRCVDKCTFGEGGISGYVASLKDNSPVSNARVKIYNEAGYLVRTLYTDADGTYSVDNLTDGTYSVKISATGHFTYEAEITVKKLEMTHVETFLMVDRNASETPGSISGNVVDAVTGSGISNTSYTLRTGWDNTTGIAKESGTFDSDEYSLELEAGNYTLEISKSGYLTNYINIAVSENASSNGNITLMPESTSLLGDEIRIELTWGQYPEDLDSHLFGPGEDGASDMFHTYFSDKNYYGSEELIADLDVDDTTSYGPENTTIHKINTSGGLYSFYVHDYTNRYSTDSSAMARSSAKVRVFSGNTRIATFNIPVNQVGTVWHVFDYNPVTDTIIPVNNFTNSSDPGTLYYGRRGGAESRSMMETYAYGMILESIEEKDKSSSMDIPAEETTNESIISETEMENDNAAIEEQHAQDTETPLDGDVALNNTDSESSAPLASDREKSDVLDISDTDSSIQDIPDIEGELNSESDLTNENDQGI